MSELGKGAVNASGEYSGDERKRTVDDVSKRARRCRNQSAHQLWDELERDPEGGSSGNRYIGGMTRVQALARNVGTCCLDDKGKWQGVRAPSANTDARRRGGAIRSSVEAPVMGVERRDRIILVAWVNQPP